MRIHATAIEMNGQAILLRGDSGSGKSDLALQLLSRGAKLIGDDYIVLHNTEQQLFVTAAPELHGMLEVRGIGIIYVSEVLPLDSPRPVSYVIDLVDRDQVPRMPEEENASIFLEGHQVPHLALHAFDASTVLKIALVCGQNL